MSVLLTGLLYLIMSHRTVQWNDYNSLTDEADQRAEVGL